MRVLVTGGAGYIGSVSSRILLNAGHDVTVLDSLERGHRGAVDPRARLIVGDVGDRSVLDSALADVDTVLHCAGYIDVAESVANPQRYHDCNCDRPRALLGAMRDHGVTKLVFSSTAAVYGTPEAVPITEDTPLHPVNPYGESKRCFEREIQQWAVDGRRAVRFRYFNVAGAWPDGSIGESHVPETHIIPLVLDALLSGKPVRIYGSDYPTDDGTCVRDYVHVADIAAAHMLALEALHGGHAGGVYNLGNERGFSNREVVMACGGTIGLGSDEIERAIEMHPRRAGDPSVLVADAGKARRELGWKPQYPTLDTMVLHALAWHRAHPQGY